MNQTLLPKADIPAARSPMPAPSFGFLTPPFGKREPTPDTFEATDGWTFLNADHGKDRAVWGTEGEILWARGETLFLAGAVGGGKTTLALRLVLARLGLGDEVLGHPVAPGEGRVLYVVADRPPQMRANLRRMVGQQDERVLAERLIVIHRVYVDITKRPTLLADLAREYAADTVIIDSFKDVCGGELTENVALGTKWALDQILDTDAEVCVLHHTNKGKGEEPKQLDQLNGSVFVGAGAGSVLSVWLAADRSWGRARQFKAPAEAVEAIRFQHDLEAGWFAVTAAPASDALKPESEQVIGLLRAVANAGDGGVGAKDVAAALGSSSPTRAEEQWVRRQLQELELRGQVVKRLVGRQHRWHVAEPQNR